MNVFVGITYTSIKMNPSFVMQAQYAALYKNRLVLCLIGVKKIKNILNNKTLKEKEYAKNSNKEDATHIVKNVKQELSEIFQQ